MDSDGQHPADHIPEFMRVSSLEPAALVLGRPVFGPEAPLVRLYGRKISTALARLQIRGRGIDDPLFGFRSTLPRRSAAPCNRRVLRAATISIHEVAVRMVWAGVPTVNLPAPCRYVARSDGGVSHFNYLRDNLVLAWLHLRLLAQLFTKRRVKRA